MDATDIKPSRLTRAKHKLLDILKKRREGQTALIVFAGEAFSITPLTDDTETIASQVESLTTDIMPIQGSNSNSALVLAQKLLKQASQLNGDILIITDGINTESLATARKMAANGYRISVLAIGTKEGSPIPAHNGGFLKDQSGSIVIPSLNIHLLSQLATYGHGQIRQLTPDDRDIDQLLAPVKQLKLTDKSKKTSLNTDTWYEAGPYLLLVLLPFAAYAFRKGILAVVFLTFLLPITSNHAQAFELSGLWKNNNQQAAELLKQNKADEAARQFSDPKWKAAALYKAGDYQHALEIYNKLDHPDTETLYNKANTLAKLGNIEQAIKTYDQVLKQDKDHVDAKYNRDLLKNMQQKQNSPQDKKQSQNKTDTNSSRKNNKQDQSGSDNNQPKNHHQKQPSQANNEKNKSGNNNKDQKNAMQKNKHGKDQNTPAQDQAEQKATRQPEPRKKAQQDIQRPPGAQDQRANLSEEQKEQQQANEQWLRRIPDDPGGLLRRKFQYLSQQHQQDDNQGQAQW
jgi:Ca-activated chloride channel family protein